MINLTNVDLIAMDCVHPDKTIRALNISKRNINFGRVILFTDFEKSNFSDVDGIEFVKIPKIKSRNEYSNFCLRLINFCHNDYILYIQDHAFIIDANNWDNQFLEYDYIGAPWTEEAIRSWNLINRVGNGAFSLRSRKFLQYSNQFNSCEGWNEDGYLTNYRLKDALSYMIKFPDPSLAFKFSCELLEKNQKFDPKNHFGFHGEEKMDTVLDYLGMKNT